MTCECCCLYSSGSTFTSAWSWFDPTQNVTGVVRLSTATVRILVSDGIRYCSVLPVFGSMRTTRSVDIVDTHNSPFLSNTARYGKVSGGRLYSVNWSVLGSNTATLLPRYSATVMRSALSISIRRSRACGVGGANQVTCAVLALILPK